jgi:hypothetical protein
MFYDPVDMISTVKENANAKNTSLTKIIFATWETKTIIQ